MTERVQGNFDPGWRLECRRCGHKHQPNTAFAPSQAGCCDAPALYVTSVEDPGKPVEGWMVREQ